MSGQEITETVMAVLAAYLWGALPTTYLVARLVKGIDLRQYGSGNVGASNLSALSGKMIGISAGVFDSLAKGTLPVVLARLLNLDVGVQIGIGLAAVAGHNWSPYIKFTGGRGVATTIGVLMAFLMWRELIVIGVLLGVVGWMILQDTGFWTFVSLLFLSPLTYLFQVMVDGTSPELVYLSLGLMALVLLKRLTSNWVRPLPGHPLPQILMYRLIYDRDVPRKAVWVQRKQT